MGECSKSKVTPLTSITFSGFVQLKKILQTQELNSGTHSRDRNTVAIKVPLNRMNQSHCPWLWPHMDSNRRSSSYRDDALSNCATTLLLNHNCISME